MKTKLQPHQEKIAKKRYFQEGEESWGDLVTRVHQAVMFEEILQYHEEIAGTNSKDDQLKLSEIITNSKDLLLERKFLFNTPTWINAGMSGARTLSACFVGNLEDKMLGDGGILDCSTWFGTVQKFGGGTGVHLSQLRSKGEPIRSTHGKACGPLMVLKYLAATSQMITQGGARDGANMAVMSVYHPDIIEFITCKSKESKYMLEIPMEYAQHKIDSQEWSEEEGEEYIEYCRRAANYQLFNVSVAVDNKFMEAVQKLSSPNHSLEKNTSFGSLPCGKTISEIWNLIIEQAHKSGDPGLLFMERAQEFARFHSPLIPHATNPCGEQYLPPHGSCNLGSIDLSKFVETDGNVYYIHYPSLEKAIQFSVRMLDNVVSINKHPVKEIEEVNQQERRIGLGIMGWADLLFKLKIPYDSNKALEVCEDVAKFFKTVSHKASVELARERSPFPLDKKLNGIPILDYDKINLDINMVHEPLMPEVPRRNATITTVAPTGTISLMAGCSSGIEPHFMLGYEHQGLKEHGGLGYIWASDTLREALDSETAEEAYTFDLGNIDVFEDHIREKYGWKPANEIDIKWHIAHQAMWQKYIDNSISKTLNLPNNSTIQDVEKSYLLSYEKGCKGSTIYRDGCKPFQVLNATTPKKEKLPSIPSVLPDFSKLEIDKDYGDIEQVSPGVKTLKKRDKIVHGVTIKEKTGDGSLYVTINRGHRDEPFELLAQVGKAGGKAHAYTEAIARLISLSLQYNIPINEIKKKLRGISAGDPVGWGKERVLSVPDGIGLAIEEFLENESEEVDESELIETAPVAPITNYEPLIDACPECGASLFKEEGCSGGKCMACGFSKC